MVCFLSGLVLAFKKYIEKLDSYMNHLTLSKCVGTFRFLAPLRELLMACLVHKCVRHKVDHENIF